MIRRYQVPEGRMLTLPADLTEGNGNTRVKGPETVDIDSARVGVHARFIANRVRLGDLMEVAYDANVPATAGDHAKPAVEAEPSSTTATAAPATAQKG